MAPRVSSLVEALGLEELDQEGGWFQRIYTGELRLDGRPQATSILALFTAERFSALHRLDADEVFFYQAGDPFRMLDLDTGGSGEIVTLGPDVSAGQRPQIVFPAGHWFGGAPEAGGSAGYTLIGAVVTPGFRWEGFELGRRAELVSEYPQFRDEIAALTRG